jgi:hypothetical protein
MLTVVINLVSAQPQIIEQGYAHNDYLQKRPLFDALENGYVNIEADIFLRDGKLIIAHWFPYLKNNRTLEDMYLFPLKKYVQQNHNSLTNLNPITLLIDIKSSPEETYAALRKLLERYSDILSSYENGIFRQGLLNVVITGRKPVAIIKQESKRLVMLDDFLDAPSNDPNYNLYAMASCKYSHVLKWRGKGKMPLREKLKLQELVAMAHLQGKKARLWASPENDQVWQQLLNCGVDYINTDRLSELKAFLLTQKVILPVIVKNKD